MIKKIIRLIASLAILNGFANLVWAGCSEYIGLASINEVSKEHNWKDNDGDYIEIKKLDGGLSNTTMQGWTVDICVNAGASVNCAPSMSLSSAAVTNGYWVLMGNPVPAIYIDWTAGFDVVLKDASSNVVDYLSVNGMEQQKQSCSYAFPNNATGTTSTRRARRQPDGVGGFDTPSGNSQPATEGENNNVGEPPPPPLAPDLSFLEDVSVGQGQVATLTFQLSSTFGSDVTINYATTNGSAIAGTHYTSTTGTATIFAGDLTATIPVPTLNSGETVDTNFFMTILSASNANILDQVAEITIGLTVGVDHFNISHGGTGVNCEASAITITAIDSLGQTLANYSGSVDISTAPGHGDWSHPNSSTNFSAIGTDVGTASYNFDGSEGGFVNLLYMNTHEEQIDINVVDAGGISEQSNNAVAADDLPIDFLKSGFKFIYGSGASPATEIIPQQTSGKLLNTGIGYEPLKIRAITTDIDTGVCSGLFSGPQNIELAIECIDPDTANCDASVDSPFNINAQPVSENLASYSSHLLTFNGNSTADLIASQYLDAGQIRLHARYAQPGDSIIGSSFPITFIPAGFCLLAPEANSDCVGSNDTEYANCLKFKNAGEAFTLNTSAQGWQADGDANFCDNNAQLLSFSGEVAISSEVIAPDIGDNGALNINSINLIAGQSIDQVTWNEVGVLRVQAGGNGYINASVLPVNFSANIGRFTPFGFFVNPVSQVGSFDDGNTGFTYVGELNAMQGAIDYLIAPQVSFVAMNALTPNAPVKNYVGEFDKSPQLSLSASTAILGKDGLTPLTISSSFSAASIVFDTAFNLYTATLSTQDHFVFDRTANSERAPFTNDIEINIDDIVDSEGVNLINPGVSFSPLGGLIRYGRLQINNVYGPETDDLVQSIRTEFYNGSEYILNDLDSGTAMDVVNIGSITITDVGNPVSPLLVSDSNVSGVVSDAGPMAAGVWDIQWSAPLNGHYGSFSYIYNAPSWLEPDVSASVSFGQYRGNDRVIYWKEINF